MYHRSIGCGDTVSPIHGHSGHGTKREKMRTSRLISGPAVIRGRDQGTGVPREPSRPDGRRRARPFRPLVQDGASTPAVPARDQHRNSRAHAPSFDSLWRRNPQKAGTRRHTSAPALRQQLRHAGNQASSSARYPRPGWGATRIIESATRRSSLFGAGRGTRQKNAPARPRSEIAINVRRTVHPDRASTGCGAISICDTDRFCKGLIRQPDSRRSTDGRRQRTQTCRVLARAVRSRPAPGRRRRAYAARAVSEIGRSGGVKQSRFGYRATAGASTVPRKVNRLARVTGSAERKKGQDGGIVEDQAGAQGGGPPMPTACIGLFAERGKIGLFASTAVAMRDAVRVVEHGRVRDESFHETGPDSPRRSRRHLRNPHGEISHRPIGLTRPKRVHRRRHSLASPFGDASISRDHRRSSAAGRSASEAKTDARATVHGRGERMALAYVMVSPCRTQVTAGRQ